MPTVQGTLYIPRLNPMKFHMNSSSDSFWMDAIPTPDWQGAEYYQPYQIGDILYLQFVSSFNFASTGTVTLINNAGTVQQTFTIYSDGMYGSLYRSYVKSVFPSVTEGVFFIYVLVPFADGSIVMYSEPLHIAASHSDTIMISYRHDYSIFDCKFGGITLPMFNLRVKGGMKSDGFAPGGKFEMYNDLDQQPVMLQTQPFNLYKILFGDGYGIPNWFAERINRAFALDYTYVDGVRYMRNEGAKLEPTIEGNNPLTAWTLECREVANPYSDHFTGGSGIIHDSGVWEDTKTVDDEKIFSTDTVSA